MNLSDTYLTLHGESRGEYKDKGSKFYAFAFHVETISQIKEILDQKRKEFYDARHVCYAYMLGFDRVNFRANDDGEPSGTAGKPILGQINSSQLTDVLIIIVRYFGGTLLGTSGLIQAYKASAIDAIHNGIIEERIVEKLFVTDFDYVTMNSVMKIIKDFNLKIIHQRQELNCTYTVSVRLSDINAVTDRFNKIDFVSFDEFLEEIAE